MFGVKSTDFLINPWVNPQIVQISLNPWIYQFYLSISNFQISSIHSLNSVINTITITITILNLVFWIFKAKWLNPHLRLKQFIEFIISGAKSLIFVKLH